MICFLFKHSNLRPILTAFSQGTKGSTISVILLFWGRGAGIQAVEMLCWGTPHLAQCFVAPYSIYMCTRVVGWGGWLVRPQLCSSTGKTSTPQLRTYCSHACFLPQGFHPLSAGPSHKAWLQWPCPGDTICSNLIFLLFFPLYFYLPSLHAATLNISYCLN